MQQPGDLPALLAMARCSALCNDSSLYYDPDRWGAKESSTGAQTSGRGNSTAVRHGTELGSGSAMHTGGG